ncbi:ABC transporter permease [Pseudochryseolinea flava]|uniref:ABC transporter permease n=1 Tax=Pseudochryseolinea flava TaxID=2059302 RepID=A0A364XW55_9BACT|nr:ABC transporter permease [Pseudochryseolinea flava]RAV98587.1 ABC transporter permease [Pseudochryseolinea flava]
MVKNYFTIAFRNIFRNKLFSTVNILGLALGICSTLLILLWVNDELKVDQFHRDVERLYIVRENQTYTDGKLFTFNSTPAPMAPFIKEKYSEIERTSRFTWPVTHLMQFEEKAFYEEGFYVDQDFVEMFSFELKAGNVKTALVNKNSIVISEKMAKKYFGDDNPLGKIIVMDTKNTFAVTGVLKPIPTNSSIRFEYLLPFQFFFDENKSWLDEWGNNNVRTFLQLRAGADVEGFSKRFKDEIRAHEEKTNVELLIQPFKDGYLHGDYENGVQSGGRIENVKIFFVLSIFVLIIACINFMNLATAQATKRAKEVGLRKAIGASPSQLFRQFMGESFLTVLLASIIALVMAFVLMPMFNQITSKDIALDFSNEYVILTFVGIVFITAFIAGSYPAIFISEFKPAQVLKGQLKSGSRAATFRKALVVVQFSLSIILIISTTVVFRQMSFMNNHEIGFDRNNLFTLWMEGDMPKKFETFRARLLQMPGIESVTASSQSPIQVGNSTYGLDWEGKSPDDRILFSNMNVDFDFIQTMKMEMAEGRPFDRNQITDSSNYIVNEKAAAKFGFKDGVAGKDLTMWEEKGKIIGVVKDFNFGSLHSEIEPIIMRIDPSWMNCLIVRARDGQNEAAIASVEKIWKEYAPAYPYRYTFMNQDWEKFYKDEGQRGQLFNALAILSIFISCLGLFGLSAFSAERRTKELGIRKALGASVPGLVRLMGKEFAVLVMIAACIGCPAGWYFMSYWLGTYAYRVDIGIATLLFATSICLLISMITISYHSLKVASSDPVKSLRYE